MASRSSHRWLLASFLVTLVATTVWAADTTSVQTKIDQRNQDIQNLEKEISAYQKQLDALSGQASSLSSTIKSLQLTQKKLAADIQVTENKLQSKTLEIQRLTSDISDHAESIDDDKRIITNSFAVMREKSDKSLIEIILGSDSVSKTLGTLNELGMVQQNLFDRIDRFAKDKAKLESTKKLTEKARADLVVLNKQIKDQRAIVVSTTNDQNNLLKETKQSESKYQDILVQKMRLKEAFEQEILTYESQLRTQVDKAKLPSTGPGTLYWPLDSIYVTQYFGNTSFSTANPQIYNGKGHTGVDFRASIGTPVKASRSGTIIGMGNTDIIPGCYSYGKWVMIKHDNGLSTLYGHLSLFSVSSGVSVSTGQIIGYSGNTGYTTGPHLHYGVYASQGVTIQSLDSSKNCRGAIIPIAPFSAYLNPLSYLPAL